MQPIEHEEQLKFYEITAQIELMDDIIRKLEANLHNCVDLQYLTAESALKIMHNNYLNLQNQLLSSKHKIMKRLYDILQEEKEKGRI